MRHMKSSNALLTFWCLLCTLQKHIPVPCAVGVRRSSNDRASVRLCSSRSGTTVSLTRHSFSSAAPFILGLFFRLQANSVALVGVHFDNGPSTAGRVPSPFLGFLGYSNARCPNTPHGNNALVTAWRMVSRVADRCFRSAFSQDGPRHLQCVNILKIQRPPPYLRPLPSVQCPTSMLLRFDRAGFIPPHNAQVGRDSLTK